MYAELIIDNAAGPGDKLYTYALPDSFAKRCEIGDRLVVPFGLTNKAVDSLVWNLSEEEPDFEVKTAFDILPKAYSFSKTQMNLIKAMRRLTLATYRQAFRTILPSGYDLKKTQTYEIREEGLFQQREGSLLSASKMAKLCDKEDLKTLIKEDRVALHESYDIHYKEKKTEWLRARLKTEAAALKKIRKGAVKQQNIIKYLYAQGEVEYNKLRQALSATRGEMKKLEELGILEFYYEDEYVSLLDQLQERSEGHRDIALNQEQQAALAVFDRTMEKGVFRGIINGVTGSGKTLIYLEMAKRLLAAGRQVLFLVPEIALTAQLVNRIKAAVHIDIAVIHAYVSRADKARYYADISSGKIGLVVGARSALFAPFKDLGLIIIDESHEKSYKSEQIPRYDAVKLSLNLSELMDINIVLGSATTSLELKHYGEEQGFEELILRERATKVAQPLIKIIDRANTELVKGNITKTLYEKLSDVFAKGEQAMILHNRRGYSLYRQCPFCKHIEKCMNCDVSMQVVSKTGELRCRYCDYRIPAYSSCSKCGKPVVDRMPAVKSVKEDLQELFPDKRIESIDADTTRDQSAYLEILSDFEEGRIDALCGTQVIAKGLDFDRVTFAAVIDADQIFNAPDYLASERAFSLMYQLAGRAGRRKKRGEVYIQSYNLDNRVIRHLVESDYEGFIEEEAHYRKLALFPPYSFMAAIRLVSESMERGRLLADKISGVLSAYVKKNGLEIQVFKPREQYHFKIKNKYNYCVLVKSSLEEEKKLKLLLYHLLITDKYKLLDKEVFVSLDFDFTVF